MLWSLKKIVSADPVILACVILAHSQANIAHVTYMRISFWQIWIYSKLFYSIFCAFSWCKICYIYHPMMKRDTVIPYQKKIKKIHESHVTPLAFSWHQYFFTGNQQILLYQEIQIQITFWYIISISFKVFWVCKDCFNKHGYNFDDVSKKGYSRPF